MGLNPANDGQVIRVPIPPLTEERRKEYVRLVKQKAEEARGAIRNVRRDDLHRIDQMTKNGEVAEDEAKREHTRLRKITGAPAERPDHLPAPTQHELLAASPYPPPPQPPPPPLS